MATDAQRRPHVHHSDMDADERARVVERSLRLEYISLGWNLVETVAGFVAGIAAGSVALVGFALDSVVEASSAAALVWRLRNEGSRHWDVESIERRAVRVVAVAFWVLAAYVGVRAVMDLIGREAPSETVPGIVIAAVSLIVMPVLAARKRMAARALDSRALRADSDQTSLCTYISAFLLVGLGANALLGWWWADAAAALCIAVLAAREGYELWTTEDFCAH